MTAQTKQEELRQKIISYWSGDYDGSPETWEDLNEEEQHVVDEVIELINSEVLSALEELEKYSYTEKTMPPMSVIPLATLQSIKNRYKL